MNARLRALVGEVLRFGLVGGLAFVVDTSVFNLLRHALEIGPLTSKTVSVVVATTVSYFCNRHWTFGHRQRSTVRREYVLFFVLNGVGLAIALACLGTSYYLLGWRGPVAENVSANVVGLGLGTAFRFWSYRRFVFTDPGTTTGVGAGPTAADVDGAAGLAASVEEIDEARHDGVRDQVPQQGRRAPAPG